MVSQAYPPDLRRRSAGVGRHGMARTGSARFKRDLLHLEGAGDSPEGTTIPALCGTALETDALQPCVAEKGG